MGLQNKNIYVVTKHGKNIILVTRGVPSGAEAKTFDVHPFKPLGTQHMVCMFNWPGGMRVSLENARLHEDVLLRKSADPL